MIFCRYEYGAEAKYGIVDAHEVLEITGDPFGSYEVTGESIPSREVKLLAPVVPSKIIAIGLNYKKHIDEMKHDLPSEPIFFLKPPSAVIGSMEPIIHPAISQRVDYEGELAVVIKKRARNVKPEDAAQYILGYTCFNDVTARDLQKKDGQWSRAKGFDTFAPIGPWIVEDLDVSDLQIETYLDGELKQRGRTSQMIFKIPELIAHVTKAMTLEPGDVISTGTPEGVGPMKPGSIVDVRIEGIGVLRNFVAEAAGVPA